MPQKRRCSVNCRCHSVCWPASATTTSQALQTSVAHDHVLLLAQTLTPKCCLTSQHPTLMSAHQLSHHWHRLHKIYWPHRHHRPMSNVFSVSVVISLQEREIISLQETSQQRFWKRTISFTVDFIWLSNIALRTYTTETGTETEKSP